MSFITSILESVVHFGEEVKYCETALKKVERGSEEELDLLLKSSFCYAFLQLQKGESFANDAVDLAEKRKDDRRLAQALCCKGFNLSRIGYSRESQACLIQALSSFELLNDIAGIADTHWLMGTMAEVIPGTEVVMHQQKAMVAYRKVNDAVGICLAQIQENSLPLADFQLAEVICNQEKLIAGLTAPHQRHLRCYCTMEILKARFMQQDLPLLKSGLEAWQQLAGENGNFHDYTQAGALLADCYRLQKLDEAVMQACVESIACCEKLGSVHGNCTMLIILANICYQQLQYADAIGYYEKADELAITIDSPYKHAYILNSVGMALLKSGDFATARQKFETALAVAHETRDQLNLIEGHRNLAELALVQDDFNHAFYSFKNLFDIAGKEGLRVQDYGRYAEAIGKATDDALSDMGILPAERNLIRLQHLQKFLEVARQQQSKPEEASAYSALAEYYEETNELQHALDYRKQHMHAYSEMVNEQSNEAISTLRMKYEAEMKDREIILLKQEKQQSLLAERLRISRDLHDDMGTTLGSIGMYCDIATEKIKKHHSRQLPELLEKIGTASRLTIDRMSDLVWSLDATYDNFENITDRMKTFAGMMLNPRDIDFAFETKGDFTGAILTMQQRKNIFLIFKEAVYNITKYAGCTMVSMMITYEDNRLQCVIEDNGIGFNQGEIASYNGNGLKNMEARTKEMNGDFTIASEPGKGTNITVGVRL